MQIIRFFLKKTRIEADIRLTEEYVPPVPVVLHAHQPQPVSEPVEGDYREILHPKRPDTVLKDLGLEKPYYQVFAQKYGFIPNLSIMDLLFNEGPDSILYLKVPGR